MVQAFLGKAFAQVVAVCIFFTASTALAKQEQSSASSLEFTRLWVEETSLGASLASAHLDILNIGAEADELVAVSSPDCEGVLLHTSRTAPFSSYIQTGTQKVDVPAQSTLTIGSQSIKILLIDPIQPLRLGMHLALTLRFRKAGEITINLPVRAAEQLARTSME